MGSREERNKLILVGRIVNEWKGLAGFCISVGPSDPPAISRIGA